MPSLVHNMTPSPIVYGQHPSCQTQAETLSKQLDAYQHMQLHSAMHIEVLGSAWTCLRTSRGPYSEPDGHVHLAMDVSSYPVWTSGGTSKRCQMLQYTWQSVSGSFAMCLEGMGTSRGHIQNLRPYVVMFV